MKVTLVLGHQKPGSFNHAVATTIQHTLETLGHEVVLHDLYQEAFDPVMPVDEEKCVEADLPADIQLYIDNVKTSDGLIFVHPNWWGGPPAILRGWIERVFRQDSMYNFTADGPVSYIGDKIVQVFSTSNTPRDIELNVYKDPVGHFWRVIVFGVFGSKSFEHRNFEPVIVSTPEQRAAWLDEVAETIRRRYNES